MQYYYNFNGTNIKRTNLIRDLGVLLDDKFILAKHIDNIADKAYKSLGFVLRECKPFTDIKAIQTVYYACVRSILEYACPMWNPMYVTYKAQLERIQKIFVNHLNYRRRFNVSSYEENCYRNGMLTLEQRRAVLDAGLLYDLVHGLVDCPDLVASLKYCTPARRTRHTSLLSVPSHSTNYAGNAPLSRLPRMYNKLFSKIDIFACSKSVFKAHIINAVKKQDNNSQNKTK